MKNELRVQILSWLISLLITIIMSKYVLQRRRNMARFARSTLHSCVSEISCPFLVFANTFIFLSFGSAFFASEWVGEKEKKYVYLAM